MRVSGALGDNFASHRPAATGVASELSGKDYAIEMARAVLPALNIDRNSDTALLRHSGANGTPGPAPALAPCVGLPASRSLRRGKKLSGETSPTMHSVYIAGRHTTVRLEPVIWETLRGIARQQGVAVHDLITVINQNRIASSLTSAIRAYVVIYLVAQALPDALPAHLFS